MLTIACILTSCASSGTPCASISVHLLAPLPFQEFSQIGPITPEQAARMFKEQVKLDDITVPNDYEFLSLPVPQATNLNPAEPPPLPAVGKRVRVETVAEYLAALKQGALAFTTWDQVVDSRFYPTASTLRFLSQAVESRRSSLPVKLLEQLPVSILGWNGSDQEQELINAAAKGITLRHYSRAGKLQKFRSTATTSKFGHSVRTYHLTELARGDFNHDGFEDSLVAVNWRYREGTGRGCEILLVQRVDKQPLKVTPFPLP